MSVLVIGSRGSRLARWQSDHVAALLGRFWPDLTTELRLFQSEGDRRLETPLPLIGGKGLFTEVLEKALREGEIDLAVHSLKDLPVEPAAALTIGAIPARADARDVLVTTAGARLASLPPAATIGTSSPRRQAQILAARPDLIVRSIRGNVDTRVRRVQEGQVDGVVLAAAGLMRLGLEATISDWMPLERMLPAPGQGALAVQCRAGDLETLRRLAPLDDPPTRAAVRAERTFLHALGGGCAVPVAAFATFATGQGQMRALVIAPDGSERVELSGRGDDPLELGHRLAAKALARGAADLLRG